MPALLTRTALAAGAVFLLAAGPTEGGGPRCEGPDRPRVSLRLATAFADGHILTEASERFKALVEAETSGRVTVEVLPAADTEDNVNLRTASGEFDMQVTGGPPLQAYAPQYFFFNGPYVIRDYAHFLRVWNGDLGDEAKALVRRNGNQVSLGTIYRGFRQMTSNRPISGPSDLIGLRLRLPVVPTWVKVWQALQAVPVVVALPMLYESLRTGQAEASEGDLTQISSLRLFEVQSHLSLTNHLVGVGWIFANEDFFQSLPHAYQRKIRQAWADASAWATQQIVDGEATLLTGLRTNGMTVVTPDAAAIRAAAKPAVDELFRTDWPVTTWEEVLAQ